MPNSAPPRSSIPKIPFAVFLLIALHLILALGAIGGGVMLILDPGGTSMGMPAALLERTFFRSFLIPGILLLSVFGMFPLIVAYGLWRRPDWTSAEAFNPYRAELHPVWAFSLYIGFGQLVWIAVQTYMMNSVSAMQLAYTGLALAILIVTLLPSVRSRFFKK
ncbi:hypothetical protein [Saccharibacillus qingshengii]|uniref:hypothetical protein n=1 Tax=Saccharibacillus qingshengii TaxID=1763540 RepID=UPI001FEBF7D2|nr:hypothetical protein [Saccharibacillus qingshengii]